MNEKATISSNQLALLAAGSGLMFPYTFMPILRVPPANQDVWIVLLLAFAYIIVINLPLVLIINRFRGLDINDINELIMGKVGGKLTSTLYMFLAMLCYILCMLMIVLYIKTYLLAKTPVWAILLAILIPVTYAVLKGAGSIARIAIFIIPVVLVSIVVFFLYGLQDMKLEALQPILSDSTFYQLNKGAFFTAARFSEILILFVFSYHLRSKASFNRVYFKSLLVFGLAFMLMLICILLIVGSDLAKLTNNPFYFYTRQVGGKDFMQRVQSLNILVWFSGTLIKLSAYGYIATYILSRIVSKKTQKFYAIPLSVIAFIVCLIPALRNMGTMHILKSDKIFPWVVAGITFGVSSFLCLVYLFRYSSVNKKLREKLEEEKIKEQKENTEKAEIQQKSTLII